MKYAWTCKILLVGILLFTIGGAAAQAEVYYPTDDNFWEKLTPESLGWNSTALRDLYEFLERCGTKSFLVLKNGKLVIEKNWTSEGPEYTQCIMSTGKSLTAFLIGVAQGKGKLKIVQPVSEILGPGWTTASQTEEEAIRIEHLLKMTSGLAIDPATAKPGIQAPPDTVWKYDTEICRLLQPILEKSVGMTMEAYAERVLFKLMGMTRSSFNGHSWIMNARDMARFGLLIQAGGLWASQALLEDPDFFKAMLNTSQPLNPAFGYLWWLNGKEAFRACSQPPAVPAVKGPLIPKAPGDMLWAHGPDGQCIFVVPSQGLVIVRLGDDPASSSFDRQLWRHLLPVISPESQAPAADPRLLQPSFPADQGTVFFDREQTIPSWANPDIRVLNAKDGADVTWSPLHKHNTYEMRVKVTNPGPRTAEKVMVKGFYSPFGVTTEFQPFGQPVTVPEITAGETVEVSIPMKTARKEIGHVSFKAEISCPNDNNPANNIGLQSCWYETVQRGITILRTMSVVNRVLFKRPGGGWELGPLPIMHLETKAFISPREHNTPENQKKVKVTFFPLTVPFLETRMVSRQEARVKVEFDRTLPRGVTVYLHVRPVSPDGRLCMDGCTWVFELPDKKYKKRFRKSMFKPLFYHLTPSTEGEESRAREEGR